MSFTIAVTDVNDLTDITLDNNAIAENDPWRDS